MKITALTTLIITGISLNTDAQFAEANVKALKPTDKTVKITATVTHIQTQKSKHQTLLYLASDQYKQPIKVIVGNAKSGQMTAFFPGENVALTGVMRLRKGYQEISISNSSQIKPLLADNIMMPAAN